jgi:hypothetical protein
VSSSSTNKQPLLIDRPLHQFAQLGETPCLADAADLATVLGGGCKQLVDCSDNDGAVIDSISIVANRASTTQALIIVFMSQAPTQFGITAANTAAVASALVSSVNQGERTNISLPPICIPVPNLGATDPAGEVDKKNTGLYVPRGLSLYVGSSVAIQAPSPTTRVNVFAQGGFF